jgi:hypothetical protein
MLHGSRSTVRWNESGLALRYTDVAMSHAFYDVNLDNDWYFGAFDFKIPRGSRPLAHERGQGAEHEHRGPFEIAAQANASNVVRLRRT